MNISIIHPGHLGNGSRLIVHAAAVTGLILGGFALVSSQVFASLTATAFNTTPISLTSATLKLTEASAGASGGLHSNITNMTPGDVVNRFVDLTNAGSAAGQSLTLSVTDDTPTALTTNATTGLHVQVIECSVAWNQTNGTCAGTTTTALSTTSLSALGSATALAVSSLTAGATSHLEFSISLPASSEVTVNGVIPSGSVQGKSASLTWNFVEAQLLSTVTNS